MKLKNITVIKNFGDLIVGKRADERSPYYMWNKCYGLLLVSIVRVTNQILQTILGKLWS